MTGMKALDRLETFLQGIMEGPQRRLTPRALHPLAIANAVTRALEESILPVGDRVVAPNRYAAHINPEENAALDGVRAPMEREMAAYVERAARERRLSLTGAARVEFVPDEAVQPGTVRVVAEFQENAAQTIPTLPIPAAAAPVAGFTERIERVAVQALPVGVAARLEMVAADGAVARIWPLGKPIVSIGRRSDNDIALLDIEVSRHHARIEAAPPRYILADLGSTNGTRLNGQAVHGRVPLGDGDMIEVGGHRLRFRAR